MSKSKFQEHCEQLVRTLRKEKEDEFAQLVDDASRIRFVYSLSEEVSFNFADWIPKDFQHATALKINGNQLFQQRRNSCALLAYNEAITRCPQDDPKGKELYAILIGNRSAVFFDNGEFDKVIKDVAFLKQYGHHPNLEKLNIRESKSFEAICKASTSDVTELEEDGSVKLPQCEELSWISRNLTYPALSHKLTVSRGPNVGRYVQARDDIQTGEIVAVERPFASVLAHATYRTNCGYCALSTNQLHACVQCCQAVYCSMACLSLARQFHQHECSIMLTLIECGVSVNNLLALRMITQRPLQQVLMEETHSQEERNVVIYKTDDYYNVSRLVSHADSREPNELIHLTFMATFLLKLLKTTSYFERKLDLSEGEALIGGLLLKYLQILQYNAYEIFELQTEQTGNVGAGVYPTLALFNHSCDPSVIRYNIKNALVLRAIKPIKAGDVVYENYGPLYMSMLKEQRANEMITRYKFECTCKACVENWPVFNNMDDNILRVLCDCGEVIRTSKAVPTPTVNCHSCSKDKNLLPVLTALIPLEAMSTRAEELFAGSHFEAAKQVYIEMIDRHLKYLVPPFGDLILLQQRLKDCLLHNGNKKFDYRLL